MIDVGTGFDQHLDRLGPAGTRRQQERRVAEAVARRDRGAVGQKLGHLFGFALLGRVEQPKIQDPELGARRVRDEVGVVGRSGPIR